MSIEFLNLAFRTRIRHSSAKFVLVALADYANEDGEAYPSVHTLMAKTDQDRKTVLLNLQRLVAAGLILDTGRRRGKTNQVKVWKLEIKQSQKRNGSGNGTVPFFPEKSPTNGTVKGSQKRDIDPSDHLTVSKPSAGPKKLGAILAEIQGKKL